MKTYKEAGHWHLYLAEVDLLTRMSHPNIIKIVDVNAVGAARLAMRDGGRALHNLCAGTKDISQWPSF